LTLLWHSGSQSKEVGVFEDKPEAHGLANQARQIGARFPIDDGVQFIAEQRRHVGQRPALNWVALLIQPFDLNRARRRRRVVQDQIFPGEGQWSRRELATGRACVDGGKAVAAHGDASQPMVRPLVVFCDVQNAPLVITGSACSFFQ